MYTQEEGKTMSAMMVLMVVVMVVAFFGSGHRGMHGQNDAIEPPAITQAKRCVTCGDDVIEKTLHGRGASLSYLPQQTPPE